MVTFLRLLEKHSEEVEILHQKLDIQPTSNSLLEVPKKFGILFAQFIFVRSVLSLLSI